MKKKVVILGAGITGLSIGRMLNDDFDVTILEKEKRIGGIAKTRIVEGASYHMIGGHCFNSKHQDVLDFVFNIMPKDEWHLVERNAKINLKDFEINYPIEFSINQIYEQDKELAFKITQDFLSSNDTQDYENLEDWFRQKFGNTLADIYFVPYNKKIWGRNPSEMSHEWVAGKLPIPNKKSFFDGLLNTQKDKMPHSYFYYPNANNQMAFIDRLSEGLRIQKEIPVFKLSKKGNGWIINDNVYADILISTIPLNILPKLIDGVDDKILKLAENLKYNRVSTVIWESKPTSKTWTYQPSENSLFHRYIHIGNFYNPVKNYTITEAIGAHSYEEMVKNGKKDSFLIKPLDYNVSDHAYVVYDDKRSESVKSILNFLEKNDIVSIGRFGQWEYFNMDICIKQSLDTSEKIKRNLE